VASALATFACVIVSLLLGADPAWAYPNSIGYGYGSCATCHYNSNGNGPLTDYGRALFATAVAAKPWISSLGRNDEELGENSGFLGSVSLPSWVRPFAGFRGMALISGLGTDSVNSRFIPMDLHAGLVLKALRDRVFFSGSLALAPSTTTNASGELETSTVLVTREHLLTIRPWKQFEVAAGLTDVAFGIRLAEHPAYIRALTGLSMNDQTHGLLLHASGSKWDATLHPFLGNLLQEASLRQQGVSLTSEVEVADRFRLGASFLSSGSDFRSRTLGAIHARVGFSEGSSLLAEFSINREDPVDDGLAAYIGDSLFLQSTLGMARGLNLLFTFEHAATDFGTGRLLFRAGPSLQYFPMQRVELRVDLTSSRVMGSEQVDPDQLSLQTQVHLAL
jgi:hypothetical protein